MQSDVFIEIARAKGVVGESVYIHRVGTTDVWERSARLSGEVTGDPMLPHVARYQLAALLSDEAFEVVFGRGKAVAEPLATIIDGMRYDTSKCTLVCRYHEYGERRYEPDRRLWKKRGQDFSETYAELVRTPKGRWCAVLWVRQSIHSQEWRSPTISCVSDERARQLLSQHCPEALGQFFAESIEDA